MKRIIAPSILSADFANLAQQAQLSETSGAEFLHIDVMDGHFVPNITLGPVVVKSLRPYSTAVFDVHLMIENPEKYIDAFADAGADLITVHYESVQDVEAIIRQIRAKGKKVGLTIKPGTPLHAILPFVPLVDMVLIMTVEPGFGGQSLIESCLDKIRELRGLYPNLDIEIDGGVKLENIDRVYDAGANIIVAGSAVFGSENPAQVISEMLNRK